VLDTSTYTSMQEQNNCLFRNMRVVCQTWCVKPKSLLVNDLLCISNERFTTIHRGHTTTAWCRRLYVLTTAQEAMRQSWHEYYVVSNNGSRDNKIAQ
jgi:hypothetical protein